MNIETFLTATGTILDRVSLDDIYDDTNWTRAEY